MVGRTGMSFAITALVMVSWPGLAIAAPSGRIDFAKANEGWTHGSLTGSVSYDMCGARALCSWTAFATVQPPARQCNAREPIPSWQDDDVQIVATVPDHYEDGATTIETRDVPILGGVVGQRLCLYLLDQGGVSNPPPEEWPPILTCPAVALPGYPCPQRTEPTAEGGAETPSPYPPRPAPEPRPRYFRHHITVMLDQRFFSTTDDPTPGPPEKPIPAPYPPPPTYPPPSREPPRSDHPAMTPLPTAAEVPTTPRVALTALAARSHAKNALTRRYGLAYTGAKRKQVTCTPSRAGFKCTFSFESGKRRRSGAVTVKVEGLAVTTQVRQRPGLPLYFDSSG